MFKILSFFNMTYAATATTSLWKLFTDLPLVWAISFMTRQVSPILSCYFETSAYPSPTVLTSQWTKQWITALCIWTLRGFPVDQALSCYVKFLTFGSQPMLFLTLVQLVHCHPTLALFSIGSHWVFPYQLFQSLLLTSYLCSSACFFPF